jgi:copper chaperone CopZ
VQSALSKVPGVIKAEVEMPDKAVVTVDKQKSVTSEKLIAAVKKAGYSAKEKKESKVEPNKPKAEPDNKK